MDGGGRFPWDGRQVAEGGARRIVSTRAKSQPRPRLGVARLSRATLVRGTHQVRKAAPQLRTCRPERHGSCHFGGALSPLSPLYCASWLTSQSYALGRIPASWGDRNSRWTPRRCRPTQHSHSRQRKYIRNHTLPFSVDLGRRLTRERPHDQTVRAAHGTGPSPAAWYCPLRWWDGNVPIYGAGGRARGGLWEHWKAASSFASYL